MIAHGFPTRIDQVLNDVFLGLKIRLNPKKKKNTWHSMLIVLIISIKEVINSNSAFRW